VILSITATALYCFLKKKKVPKTTPETKLEHFDDENKL
jgi:hypothetical protein